MRHGPLRASGGTGGSRCSGADSWLRAYDAARSAEGRADLGPARDDTKLDKILLTGFTPDCGRSLESPDAFVDFAGRHAELGFTGMVIHWPVPGSLFATDQKVFEQIAMEAPA